MELLHVYFYAKAVLDWWHEIHGKNANIFTAQAFIHSNIYSTFNSLISRPIKMCRKALSYLLLGRVAVMFGEHGFSDV